MKDNNENIKRGNYNKIAKEAKAEILASVDATQNVSLVAMQTGVPRQTLQSWLKGIGVDDEIQQIRQIKKSELRDLHKLIAVKSLGLLSTKLEEAKPSELATIAAISTDKMQLLGDEPTSIIENLSREEREAKIIELINTARERKLKFEAQQLAIGE